MAGYNTIRGLRVKYLSADPANAENGQVWYNSTTGNLRVDGIGLASSWASGGNLSTGRGRLGGAGTQTSGVVFGGFSPALSPVTTGVTEEYNGSAWTGGVSLPQAKFGIASATSGSQTAALGWAGRFTPAPYPSPNTYYNTTEEFDGSSWTGGGNYPISGVGMAGTGTQTAALGFAQGTPNYGTVTASYNGSTWTAVNSMNTARSYVAGFGTQTAAIATGGNPQPSQSTTVESWDGTNWTTVNSYTTGRGQAGASGVQTSGLLFGGYNNTASVTATESYDGTNWSAQTSLATARRYLAGFGTSSSALAAGGFPSITATEEFTGATVITKNITTS